jgi:Bacterial SH3 domain
METLYMWLLIFGGSGLLLLGIFLFASDRKFGKHHRLVDASRRKRQFSESQHSEIRSPARLMPTNEELVEKIPSLLSRQHEEGQRMVEELQTEQPQLAGTRCDNHEVQEKIVNLLKQLHANERRLSDSAREIQRIGHQNSKLQTEVTNLKQQLKASQAKQQQLLNQLQATKSIRNEELLAKIDSISPKLAGSQTTVDELQTPQNGRNSDNQQFQAVDQEPQAQITTVKDQLQTSEHRFSELASQNQQSAECHATRQTELPEPTRGAGQSEATTKEISQHLQKELALRDDNKKQVSPLGELIDPLQKQAAPLDSNFQPPRKLAVRSSAERNRPVGIIPAAAAIAIVGAIAIGFVRTSSNNGVANAPQRPGPSVAESRVTTLETSTEPGIAEAIEETESKTTEVVKQTPATTSAPRLRGAFETVRPIGLFNGPSEESALIRTLAAGTKINVIDSRDGWLEVRSMDGTSGFVRQVAAVKTKEDKS